MNNRIETAKKIINIAKEIISYKEDDKIKKEIIDNQIDTIKNKSGENK